MIIYSRTSIAQTGDGDLTRLVTTGPYEDQLKINDQEGNELLSEILNQVKALNFQMATITEN